MHRSARKSLDLYVTLDRQQIAVPHMVLPFCLVVSDLISRPWYTPPHRNNICRTRPVLEVQTIGVENTPPYQSTEWWMRFVQTICLSTKTPHHNMTNVVMLAGRSSIPLSNHIKHRSDQAFIRGLLELQNASKSPSGPRLLTGLLLACGQTVRLRSFWAWDTMQGSNPLPIADLMPIIVLLPLLVAN
jgi:hypothetical protein